MRRLGVGCAAVVAVGGATALAVGCSVSHDAAPARRPAADPSAQQRAALAAVRSAWHTSTTVSPVFDDRGEDTVAVAGDERRSGPVQPEVTVYTWHHASWSPSARVPLDVGGTIADVGEPPTPIALSHVTRAATPDLLVTVRYNAGPATAVLSKVSGRWRSLVFSGGVGSPGDERLNVRVNADGKLTSTENDCVPDCAQGHPVRTVYGYDRMTEQLAPS